MRNRSILAFFVCSLLLGLSPLAADSVIQRGIDAFVTPANGTTFYDFSQSPIPAGFFCKGSKPFTGKVTFKGLPLATGAPGALWKADTVIERLDDAVFDDKGIAMTRIQFRALSLVSIAPIKTGCGAYHVYVTLSGNQPVTSMDIYRTQERGGNFVAPLALHTRMTFIPVKPTRGKAASRNLELAKSVTFPASPLPWSFNHTPSAKRIGSAVVDINGDLAPDIRLPATTNFLPGVSPDRFRTKGTICCSEYVCHAAEGHEHCYWQPPGPECRNIECHETMY